MSLYTQNYVSKKSAKDGVWVEMFCGEGVPNARFKLAYRCFSTNPDYGAAFTKVIVDNRSKVEEGALSKAEDDHLMLCLFCEYILLDWEGVADLKEKEIPFNKENAIRVMTDLPPVYDYLKQRSVEISLFQQKDEKKQLGNLKAS